MCRLLFLALLFCVVRAEALAPTLPPRGLRVVLCHIPHYKASELCRNHTEVGVAEATSPPSSTTTFTHFVLQTIHASHTHIIAVKVTVPFFFLSLFYILFVLFLHFYVGFSCKRAFALGAGKFCTQCVVHIYHRPDLPV